MNVEHAGCANCATPLEGEFCHRCGQAAHVHKSLLHLGEEFLHGLLHFETKSWRTIPMLLLRPGKLTRDFIDGHRVRYVSPLALLLFLIFAMFLVFSLTSPPKPIAASETSAAAHAATPAESAQALRVAVSRYLPWLAIPSIAQEVDRALSRAQGPMIQIEGVDDTSAVQRKLAHALENPDLTLYKIKGAAAKFAVLLMPISLPFLWLLLASQRRRFGMFDHAVFSLYSLSAMALLMMAVAICGYFGLTWLAAGLATVVPPLHLFAQLRGTYGLGALAAAWRTAALLFVAGCAIVVYGVVVLTVSA
jgi:hypothetical protein